LNESIHVFIGFAAIVRLESGYENEERQNARSIASLWIIGYQLSIII